MAPDAPPWISAARLVDAREVFLLDSYGVLVNSQGPIPHAQGFIEHLHTTGKRFTVLSNDASRLPETSLQRFTRLGFRVTDAVILTSADLIAQYVRECNLAGARALVLGPDDSLEIVRRAGCDVVPWNADDCDVVFVCDDDGYPFLEAIGHVLALLFRKLDRGDDVRLCLPNPDVIYPTSGSTAATTIGITAGGAALLIERGLAVRFVDEAPHFDRLGKPGRLMFEEACRRLGTSDPDEVVMVGDQLGTDVCGALDFGIAAALVGTGIANVEDGPFAPRPTWRLRDLCLTR